MTYAEFNNNYGSEVGDVFSTSYNDCLTVDCLSVAFMLQLTCSAYYCFCTILQQLCMHSFKKKISFHVILCFGSASHFIPCLD